MSLRAQLNRYKLNIKQYIAVQCLRIDPDVYGNSCNFIAKSFFISGLSFLQTNKHIKNDSSA